MQVQRKLIVYIAASVDGYIAKPNDDLSFLAPVEREGEDYGYLDFISTVDTVLVGRKTYEWVMKQVSEFPHSGKQTFVITRTARAKEGNIEFYTGDIRELVTKLKHAPGNNIFCDGGADLVNSLLQDDLVDEFILSIIPVLVGAGTRLFGDDRPEHTLKLVSIKQFESGLVQIHYKRATN
ncbi:dihydrofolate reductase [Segetibacter sp. 3557_3]|nr:dihydrofolate reductase [Segetibacter sp. 3557_3]